MKLSPAEGAAPASRSWPVVWAWSLAVWFVVWVLMSSQAYAYYRGRDLPVPWVRFVGSLSDALLWGLASPLALWFCWRWPLSGGRRRTTPPLPLLAGLLLPPPPIAPASPARYGLGRALADPGLYQPLSPGLLFHNLVGNIFAYIDVVAVGLALHYARDSRAKDLRASRLEARLAEAQLQVLRMQLHPHFLFNTLHTISALMQKDLKAAAPELPRGGGVGPRPTAARWNQLHAPAHRCGLLNRPGGGVEVPLSLPSPLQGRARAEGPPPFSPPGAAPLLEKRPAPGPPRG